MSAYAVSQKLVIYGRMTSMNDYIDATRYSKYSGARIKKDETERVAWECKIQKIPHYTIPISLSITIQFENKRSDQDGALLWVKFLQDGMVMAGVIKNDTPRYVTISHIGFSYGKETKTIVEIYPLLT